MVVLQINSHGFNGELLGTGFTVTAKSQFDEDLDMIATYATFHDPDKPGTMHTFTCVTNFSMKLGMV